MRDLLDVMQHMSAQMDRRFDGIDQRFDGVDQRFVGVDQRLDGIDQRIDGLEKRVTNIEGTMVTKDYLDRKIAEVRSDFVAPVYRQDEKVNALVNVLERREVISTGEANNIRALKPFAQI